MIKEVPLAEMKRTLSNNMKTYKSIKLNSKGKYTISEHPILIVMCKSLLSLIWVLKIIMLNIGITTIMCYCSYAQYKKL